MFLGNELEKESLKVFHYKSLLHLYPFFFLKKSNFSDFPSTLNQHPNNFWYQSKNPKSIHPKSILVLLTLLSFTMEANSSTFNYAQTLIPIFEGENYEYWSIQMKTLFISQDLWDLVESGYEEPANDEEEVTC